MNRGLIIEHTDAVIHVRIDAGADNLFTPQMTRQLTTLLDDPPAGARILRLSAAGESFCLGRAPFRDGVEELQVDVHGLVGLNRALTESPLVTLTEVQGDAAGFGAGVVALSDVAIIAPAARLSFPEVDAGFAPALVLSWLAPMVGRRTAFWLTATGEALPASEAYRLGLVTLVAESRDGLEGTVARAIELLLSKAPPVHEDIKRLMRLYGALPEGSRSGVAADRLSLGALQRAFADGGPQPVPALVSKKVTS